MAKTKPAGTTKPKGELSYTELVHQVVRETREPLPFQYILQRVHTLRRVNTRNPAQTIRNAIAQSRLIVNTGDHRYGWLPRVINGSLVRLILSKADVKGDAIEFGEDLREMMWPAFFEQSKRRDTTPVQLRLPDGTVCELTLDHLEKNTTRWGTKGAPEFWKWLRKQKAEPGDQLLFSAIDGEAKSYGVLFEPHAARAESAIAARNDAIVEAASAFLRRSVYGAADWDTARHLLATGLYRHAVPPDPLAKIWTRDIWAPILDAKKPPRSSWVYVGPPKPAPKRATRRADEPYDFENPELPSEYEPGPGRRPRPSATGKQGTVKVFTLHVNHRALPEVWREIEIAEDNNLEDLHLMIQRAYGWSDDHLYSFFMSGRAWDKQSEIGCPWSEAQRHTHETELGELNLKKGDQFLYLFDYGDNHEFDVRVADVDPAARKGTYPKMVGKQGKSPPQYPDYDEETGEPKWDPYAHHG